MAKQPKWKPNRQITLHRDGTVSYWDVYLQQWRRKHVALVDSRTLATMGDDERARITAAGRWPG